MLNFMLNFAQMKADCHVQGTNAIPSARQRGGEWQVNPSAHLYSWVIQPLKCFLYQFLLLLIKITLTVFLLTPLVFTAICCSWNNFFRCVAAIKFKITLYLKNSAFFCVYSFSQIKKNGFQWFTNHCVLLLFIRLHPNISSLFLFMMYFWLVFCCFPQPSVQIWDKNNHKTWNQFTSRAPRSTAEASFKSWNNEVRAVFPTRACWLCFVLFWARLLWMSAAERGN